jgi:hypothetical protein
MQLPHEHNLRPGDCQSQPRDPCIANFVTEFVTAIPYTSARHCRSDEQRGVRSRPGLHQLVGPWVPWAAPGAPSVRSQLNSALLKRERDLERIGLEANRRLGTAQRSRDFRNRLPPGTGLQQSHIARSPKNSSPARLGCCSGHRPSPHLYLSGALLYQICPRMFARVVAPASWYSIFFDPRIASRPAESP